MVEGKKLKSVVGRKISLEVPYVEVLFFVFGKAFQKKKKNQGCYEGFQICLIFKSVEGSKWCTDVALIKLSSVSGFTLRFYDSVRSTFWKVSTFLFFFNSFILLYLNLHY